MRWVDVSEQDRQTVLQALRTEAQRRQGEAHRGQGAAAALGRPSLLEGPLQVAAAFEAAIALLEGEAQRGS